MEVSGVGCWFVLLSKPAFSSWHWLTPLLPLLPPCNQMPLWYSFFSESGTLFLSTFNVWNQEALLLGIIRKVLNLPNDCECVGYTALLLLFTICLLQFLKLTNSDSFRSDSFLFWLFPVLTLSVLTHSITLFELILLGLISFRLFHVWPLLRIFLFWLKSNW